MVNKRLIFIDDSGDPGFRKASSANFVLAAAVFIDQEVAAELSSQIDLYRHRLGWRDDYEFKFTKIRKDIIADLLRIVVRYNFQIYATYINKASFRDTTPTIDNEKLYNWAMKELLKTIPFENAKIRIDGRSSKAHMRQTATYLRHQLNPGKIQQVEIRFEDSVDNSLIQLADLIAGAINRFLNGDKTDAKVYYRILRQKIAILKNLNQNETNPIS